MTAKLLPAALLFASLTAGALTAACSDPGPSDGTGGTTNGSGGGNASGGTASGGADSGDATVPTDTTQAGLEAFLAAESYKSAPWVFDAAPRTPADTSSSPHGDARVYFNPTAITSRTAEENDYGDDPGNAANSMAVKEMYDTAGTLLGKAIMLRTAATGPSSAQANEWLYYCSSSSPTCATGEAGPLYGAGHADCKFCHGGLFFAPVPP